MSENWYEILGVEPTASEAEIKGAWRSLVTVLGPTDHRFASINEAASILLDSGKRGAYDASFAADEPTVIKPSLSKPKPAKDSKAAKAPKDSKPASAAKAPKDSKAPKAPKDSKTAKAPKDSKAPKAVESAPPPPVPVPVVLAKVGPVGPPVGTAPVPEAPSLVVHVPRRSLLAGIVDFLSQPIAVTTTAVVAVALVVAAILVWTLKDTAPPAGDAATTGTVTVNLTDVSFKPIKQQVDTLETPNIRAAVAAAVAATPKILNYNYRTLNSWAAVAKPYMSADFAKTFMPYFSDMVAPNAKRQKTVTTCDPVLDAGVISVAPGVVEVLVIVDVRTSFTGASVVAQNFAAMTMVNQNGTWLVSKIGTAPISQS